MADWVDSLLAKAQVAPRTIAQYAAGLRYWDTWHRIRFGSPLALAKDPSNSVGSEALNAFIEDHLAIAVDGRLQMRMPPSIFNGLREAGFNARIDCVTPSTSDWRLQVVQQAHRLLGLQFDRKLIRERKREIYAVWEAERAALGVPVALPMSATNTVNVLLGTCGKDRAGIMDAALIVLLCRLTPHQVAQLRFTELLPGTVMEDDEEIDAVTFTIRNPINDFQTFQPNILLTGTEAALIKAWGALREDESKGDDWFFVRKPRRNVASALDYLWIGRRIRQLAKQAGLADASGRTTCSPQWLRKAHERQWREQSNLVTTAHAARIGTHSVTRIVRQYLNRDSTRPLQ